MKRRTFLLLSLITFITRSFAKGNNLNELKVVRSVLNHLFPSTGKFTGSDKFNGFDFLIFISKHHTFDKSDFEFILEGAKDLYERNNNFINLTTDKKEKLLRSFEQTQFGQNWLSTLIYYGIEAMIGDPIYGGNKNMTGWNNFNHTVPVPTAKKPFGK